MTLDEARNVLKTLPKKRKGRGHQYKVNMLETTAEIASEVVETLSDYKKNPKDYEIDKLIAKIWYKTFHMVILMCQHKLDMLKSSVDNLLKARKQIFEESQKSLNH